MRTSMKVCTAVLLAAVCVYLATRPSGFESVPRALGGSVTPGAERASGTPPPLGDLPARDEVQKRQSAAEPPQKPAAHLRTEVLRVTIEGITEEEAQTAVVTVTAVDGRRTLPREVWGTWRCQGLISEFDLSSFLAGASAREGDSRIVELEVSVNHALHLKQMTQVPVGLGVKHENGQTVYEVEVQLTLPVYWPEFTLAVRDASTRKHLDGVELRCVPTAFMVSQLPWTGDPITLLGSDLSSPIGLLGGREADGPPAHVAGLALRPPAGEAPLPADLSQPEATDRGVFVFARAPGHAWGRIVVDVSTGAERQLLLGPETALNMRLTNVQLERYAALKLEPTLRVVRPNPRGGENRVWAQELDATMATEGQRLDGLEAAEYIVYVDLSEESWGKKKRVLAREKLSLTAGETRELVLALADPPPPTVRTSLGGVVAFPAFGGEKSVSMQLYEAASYQSGGSGVDLSLADLESVGGALPTWSFRVEDLPVGLFQVQLWPFLKSWMIEVPAGGAENVELIIPELAEVLVETVNAQTGERVPLEKIRYGNLEVLPGQVHQQWNQAAFEDQPGRFRFWMTPGAAYVMTLGIPAELNYGGLQRKDLELVPGLQSVRLELAPRCAIRFEFRVGGTVLPRDDDVWVGVSRGIAAVDHEGHVTFNKLQSDRLVEVSAPGTYDVGFDGIGKNRFLPIPPQRVDVRPGETADVVVELRRK